MAQHTTADIQRVVDSAGRLSHTDPQELWTFLGVASQNLEDEMFWQRVHDALCQSGTSVRAADAWIAGMKSLASGRLP